MATSWTRETVIEKVRAAADALGPSNTQQIAQLRFSLERTEESAVFSGLYAFFSEPELQENSSHRQELAGELLLAVSPECTANLEQVLIASLPFYELSVEQFPWYLSEKFGAKNVMAIARKVKQELSGAREEQAAETLAWWCRQNVGPVTEKRHA